MVTAPRGQQQQSQGLTKALSLQRARPQARSPLRRHATSTERRRKRLGPGHVVAAAATTPIRGASEPPRGAPEIGASGLPNRFWEWRGQRIRYQVAGEDNVCGPSLVLVHGLFVNADHWRNNISALAGEYGMRVSAGEPPSSRRRPRVAAFWKGKMVPK